MHHHEKQSLLRKRNSFRQRNTFAPTLRLEWFTFKISLGAFMRNFESYESSYRRDLRISALEAANISPLPLRCLGKIGAGVELMMGLVLRKEGFGSIFNPFLSFCLILYSPRQTPLMHAVRRASTKRQLKERGLFAPISPWPSFSVFSLPSEKRALRDKAKKEGKTELSSLVRQLRHLGTINFPLSQRDKADRTWNTTGTLEQLGHVEH